MGLQRIIPGTEANDQVDDKIGAALNAENPRIKYEGMDNKPWEKLPERNRSSTYVGTNVSDFTPEQQAIIKGAIMDAAPKTDLPNGNTFSSVDDVKFLKGKDGSTVIEVQGQLNMDVDIDKLRKSLDGAKDKFKDVKINGQDNAMDKAKAAAAAIMQNKPDGVGNMQDADHRLKSAPSVGGGAGQSQEVER